MRKIAPIPASVTDEAILTRLKSLLDDEWQSLHDMADLDEDLGHEGMLAQIRKTNLAEMRGDVVTALFVDPEQNSYLLFE